MPGQGWPIRLLQCLLIVIGINPVSNCLHADEPKIFEKQPAAKQIVSPEQDDAQIHDLKMLGDQLIWAVGDQGVIWKSQDHGKNWELQNSPVSCSWKSICFLTNQRGWIGGSTVQPHTGLPYGVLLFTKDGGKTWTQQTTKKLPPIYHIQFFDLQSGILIGQSNGQSPSGVLLTEDGGKTWLPITGKRNQNWLTATFFSPSEGIVAGRNGSLSLIGSNRFLSTSPINLQDRAIHSLAIKPNETGWLVGDGGLILKTDSGGINWEIPENMMPAEARKLFDFHSVTIAANHVWIAGNPGSIIWHSNDQGKTWEKQSTSLTGKINSIEFSSETHGCAAGSLGTILITNDSGKNWKTVRGPDRQLAMMGIFSEPEKIPFELMAKFSKDQGYRSQTLLPIHNKLRPEHRVSANDHLHLESAMISAGSSGSEYGWQFNIDIPGLEYSTEKLLKHWQEQTDYQFREQFLGRLVRDIRNWKPSLIVINRPKENDAPTKILQQAIKLASEQAGDSGYYPEHKLYASLSPWKVKKVIERLPEGQAGTIRFSPYDYLKHAGNTIFVVSSSARTQITHKSTTPAKEIGFHVLKLSDELKPEVADAPRLFSGISLIPGSSARRHLTPLNEELLEQQQAIAKRQRNFRSYTKQYLDDPRHAAQVIGQLHQITKGMSDEQSALQLIQLAKTYRTHGNWDLYEATLADLVTRFPHEPASFEAMKNLIHLWAGFEPSWQRIKKQRSYSHQLDQNFEQLRTQIRQAARFVSQNPSKYQVDFYDKGKSTVQISSREATVKIGRNTLKNERMRHWQQQAFSLADLVRVTSPQLYQKPEIQFPLAKLLRENDQSKFAEHFYQTMQTDENHEVWNSTAAAEIWLASSGKQTSKNIYRCKRTEIKPYLDGLLSDECWLDAEMISLTDEETFEANRNKKKNLKNPEQDHAFAMMSYDEDYLYLAYSIPHHEKIKPAEAVEAGRIHDADLTGYDQIHLDLDIDRDYSTWYSLHVDQRGQTRDACWNNPLWNPKWHVKTLKTETHWRMEIAIPFSELTDSPPNASTTWAASLIRVIPSVGIESWSHPSTIEPSPPNFGLIRFQ